MKKTNKVAYIVMTANVCGCEGSEPCTCPSHVIDSITLSKRKADNRVKEIKGKGNSWYNDAYIDEKELL